MKSLQNMLAHITIVFVGVFITLVILNIFNPAMQFLTSAVTQVFLLAFCFSALSLAVVTVMENRYYAKLAQRRQAEVLRTQYGDPAAGRTAHRE